jgi:flavin reductase (DIM6/NTAB) family NADH-FMN oxidoreductase RutF
VRSSGRYAVNVLGADQQALSDCFAHAPVSPGREEFCGAAWHRSPGGLPLIDGAIATLECTTVETFGAGDHDLFVGRVDSLQQDREGVAPLLYFRRRYLRVVQGSDSPVEGKPEG